MVISENMSFEGKEYSNIFEYLDKFVDNTLYGVYLDQYLCSETNINIEKYLKLLKDFDYLN